MLCAFFKIRGATPTPPTPTPQMTSLGRDTDLSRHFKLGKHCEKRFGELELQ